MAETLFCGQKSILHQQKKFLPMHKCILHLQKEHFCYIFNRQKQTAEKVSATAEMISAPRKKFCHVISRQNAGAEGLSAGAENVSAGSESLSAGRKCFCKCRKYFCGGRKCFCRQKFFLQGQKMIWYDMIFIHQKLQSKFFKY